MDGEGIVMKNKVEISSQKGNASICVLANLFSRKILSFPTGFQIYPTNEPFLEPCLPMTWLHPANIKRKSSNNIVKKANAVW